MDQTQKRFVGSGLVAVGVLLVILGIVAVTSGGSADDPAASPPATTAVSQSTPQPSAEPAPTITTAPAPTTSAPANSTTAAPTSTTEPPADQIGAFIPEFNRLLDGDDVPGLLAHLHSAVTGRFGSELCTGYLAATFAGISDYQITGPITGPETTTYTLGESELDVAIYAAAVSFTSEGQAFEGAAAFAIEDSEVKFFTNCDGS